MTQNQINYWKLQEDTRHNLAGEAETSRHNQKQEGIDISNLAETSRHNVVSEQELGRHNRVAEGETVRHNRAQEGIDLSRLGETVRHNQAVEGTTRYANVTGRLSQQEDARHNRVSESNQSYSAVSERIRSNADAALKEAQQRLADIDADWRAVQNAENLRMTASQTQHYQQQNDEITQKIELMRTQITNGDLDAAWRTYDEVLKGLNAASNVVSSVGRVLH
nr:putative ORF1 [Marmot picobirnavirus]